MIIQMHSAQTLVRSNCQAELSFYVPNSSKIVVFNIIVLYQDLKKEIVLGVLQTLCFQINSTL